MKTAFLTESNYQGKVPVTHPNMRTEMAWQAALQSDHFNLFQYADVKGYDAVFVIFPKALVKLNMIGVEMTCPNSQRDTHNLEIYRQPVIETLKKHNKKVCFIQEGPTYVFNDYGLDTQFLFFNQVAECDLIFAHNEYDTRFYKGLFPHLKVTIIPTLMYEPTPTLASVENKAIIGGNMARWYGGFQSYMVAEQFGCPIYVPKSHCQRPGEEQMPNLHHLPWVSWDVWMTNLATFKYAVNLMPTVAAGTFSLNCAYWGIPCIGNENVDTQRILHPSLSVDVHDVYKARQLAIKLVQDPEFYVECSAHAINMLHKSKYMNIDRWLEWMYTQLGDSYE